MTEGRRSKVTQARVYPRAAPATLATRTARAPAESGPSRHAERRSTPEPARRPDRRDRSRAAAAQGLVDRAWCHSAASSRSLFKVGGLLPKMLQTAGKASLVTEMVSMPMSAKNLANSG